MTKLTVWRVDSGSELKEIAVKLEDELNEVAVKLEVVVDRDSC